MYKRGESEASSNCSLGACWADSPLLRPQQVTYLTQAAKNKNCWCVQTCTLPPHPHPHPTAFHLTILPDCWKLPQVESRGFPLRKNCLEKHCGHAGATIKCPYGQTRFIYPMLCFTCMICCYVIFCIHATNNGVLHYCIMHGWMNVKYVYTL